MQVSFGVIWSSEGFFGHPASAQSKLSQQVAAFVRHKIGVLIRRRKLRRAGGLAGKFPH